MWEKLSIRNFQSLLKVDLYLGNLTVIVGPSSSGKTAVFRAVRTLVSNSHGARYVSTGQSSASVSLRSDQGTVTIQRGPSKGSYKLAPVVGVEQTFTKLSGSVPEEITSFLQVPPVATASLNFAAQFDAPYLVSSTGSQVATTLGELTNVSTIFAASREANRRRLAVMSELKVRQADLAVLLDRAKTFQGLSARVQAMTKVENGVADIASAQVRVERLRVLTESLEEAQHEASTLVVRPVPSLLQVPEVFSQWSRLSFLIQELEESQRAVDSSVIPVVPDLREMSRSYSRWLSLRSLCVSWGQAQSEVAHAQADLVVAQTKYGEAQTLFRETLASCGVCPTCGSSITERSDN